MLKFISLFAGNGLRSVVLFLCFSAGSLHAATVVDIQTTFGFIRIDLYEDEAPELTARFLENVDAGVYDLTMIHFALGGMLRGGLFDFQSCQAGPVEAEPGARHPLVENGLANGFETFALRRDPQDSNQITNAWQMNLANGVEDDNSDQAPVVIGKIIGGMTIADNIHSNLQRIVLSPDISIPTINYPLETYNCSFLTTNNIVYTTMESRDVVNVYEAETEQIIMQVNAGEAGYLELAFQIESAEQGTIRALADSVVILDTPVAGMASFDTETGELYIPEIAIGEEIPFVDAIFQLTDSENLIFTLQSVEQP